MAQKVTFYHLALLRVHSRARRALQTNKQTNVVRLVVNQSQLFLMFVCPEPVLTNVRYYAA